MQEAVTVTVPPPQAPAVRIDAGPTTTAQTIAIPQNTQDIAGLRQRREELVDQLDRARNRRSEVIGQIQNASGIERGGLEQRLATIDQRIVQIELDIGATERALTSAPSSLLGAAAQAEQAREDARDANRPAIDEDVFIMFAFMAMALMIPIVIAHTRRIWKRPQPARALSPVTESRLERIEQAVESIAVEVERVSEGQRFVTKLMSDGKQRVGP
ncbi:MAG TPA: hypothetical protein VMY38_04930 [Gemmatimonadaceae bacterium]|nr:hypothetical protein [Gemmatimonadaceae bacterium]